MQPETQVKTEEKIVQPQNVQANTNSVDSGSKSVEAQPDIKSEENKTNWKAFREQREAERKEREAAQRAAAEEKARAEALKAALEAITNKPVQNQPQGEYQDESEDDRIQKKIDAAVEARLERERIRMQEEQRQREMQEAPHRIQQAFPDFNNVVTTENCDYLDYHYPELTAPFKYMPDGFEKWSAMYKAIKKFVPNTDTRKDQVRANVNMAKPGSLSAPGAAQGASAMPAARLDEARKAANWERMQKTLKGLS